MMQWVHPPYPRYGELTITLGSDFKWYTSKPFQAEIEEGDILTIRPGFRTDLASVPLPARPLFRTWGRWARPALVHDYHYSMGGCTRKWADRKFEEGLESEGASWVTRKLFYLGVRSFGWLAWNR